MEGCKLVELKTGDDGCGKEKPVMSFMLIRAVGGFWLFLCMKFVWDMLLLLQG